MLPRVLKGRSPEDMFRVWVPGCSSGEEVYSVAMCLVEYMWEAGLEIPIQVFGTDLSESALQKARAGMYPESIAADMSSEQLRRFFVRIDGSYRITRAVRDVCVFARQNVTKDPPFLEAGPDYLSQSFDISRPGAAEQGHATFPLRAEAERVSCSGNFREYRQRG